MPLFQLLDSLLNFVAPALFIAVAMPLAAHFLFKRHAAVRSLWAQMVINFLAGVAVLVAGLLIQGRDGMMWTYAALVVICGTGQWLLAHGFRR